MTTKSAVTVQMGGSVVIAISANDSRSLSLVNRFIGELEGTVSEEMHAEAEDTAETAEKAFGNFQNGGPSGDAPASPVAPAPPVAPVAGDAPSADDVDSRGVPWSEEHHASRDGSTGGRNRDGSWKAKRGGDKAAREAYEAPYLNAAPAPTAPAPAPTAPAPAPTAPAPAPTAPAPATDTPQTLPQFMPWYNARKSNPEFADAFAAACEAFGVENGLAGLCANVGQIPNVAQMLVAMGY